MRHKLLLADDSPTIRRVIELTFVDENFEVVSVQNGRQAIDRVGVERPDIVLVDSDMPECDGYEVAARIKSDPALAHIPVVLLTGAFEGVDEDRMRESGCDWSVTKPFEPQALVDKVKALVAGPPAQPPAAPKSLAVASSVREADRPPEPVRPPSPAAPPERRGPELTEPVAAAVPLTPPSDFADDEVNLAELPPLMPPEARDLEPQPSRRPSAPILMRDSEAVPGPEGGELELPAALEDELFEAEGPIPVRPALESAEAPGPVGAEPDDPVDAYLERLDAAFARLNPYAARAVERSAQAVPAEPVRKERSETARPPAGDAGSIPVTRMGVETPVERAGIEEPRPSVSLDAPAGRPQPVTPAPPPPAAEAPIIDPPVLPVPASAPVSLADAFETLLAVEQAGPELAPVVSPTSPPPVPQAGQQMAPGTQAPPARAGAAAPEVGPSDDLVEQVARRVLERLSDRMIRDTVTDVVLQVADRLVREEIDRIKGEDA